MVGKPSKKTLAAIPQRRGWDSMNRRRWKYSSKETRASYSTWTNMLYRCHDPEHQQYADYGARGIIVCERWRADYDAFYEDMGLRPAGKSIERRDNDGPYSPENCYWADDFQQAKNKRSSRIIEGKTLGEWCIEAGLSISTVRDRLARGLPLRTALMQFDL